MTMPLEGYRILDMTTWVQCVTARMLGDLGAEVIKIEPQPSGDPYRGIMGWSKVVLGATPRNGPFEHANFNKKSIVLDLKQEAGRKVLYELVEKSDVFVHNLRRSATVKLGIDYATMSSHNPRLIYALSSGWGSNGPDEGKASFDRLALARSGIMSISGEPGAPPTYINGAIADHTGATMCALGLIVALLMREKNGQGQEVECSLLGSMMHLMSQNIDTKLITDKEIPRQARVDQGNPLWNEYRCSDDRWISLGMLQPDRYWHSFCQLMRLEHLEKDPRFENIVSRGQNARQFIAILDETFATKTRVEWLDILRRGDIIVEPVNSVADLLEDPQVSANNYIDEFDHPTWGKTRLVVTPIRLGSSSASSIRLPAPEFGQHTEEVLQNILGYSWEDIIKLKDAGVI